MVREALCKTWATDTCLMYRGSRDDRKREEPLIGGREKSRGTRGIGRRRRKVFRGMSRDEVIHSLKSFSNFSGQKNALAVPAEKKYLKSVSCPVLGRFNGGNKIRGRFGKMSQIGRVEERAEIRGWIYKTDWKFNEMCEI